MKNKTENRKILWVDKEQRDKVKTLSLYYRKPTKWYIEDLIDREYEIYIQELVKNKD